LVSGGDTVPIAAARAWRGGRGPVLASALDQDGFH